jgi:hypothetical protein
MVALMSAVQMAWIKLSEDAVAAEIRKIHAHVGRQAFCCIRYEEAAGPARSATAMLEQELGSSNANVATALLLEAAIALCHGEPAGAEVAARRALDIRQRVNGAGSKEAAAATCTLSDALRELGR